MPGTENPLSAPFDAGAGEGVDAAFGSDAAASDASSAADASGAADAGDAGPRDGASDAPVDASTDGALGGD